MVRRKTSHTLSGFNDSMYIPFRGSGYECTASQTRVMVPLAQEGVPCKLVKAQSAKVGTIRQCEKEGRSSEIEYDRRPVGRFVKLV